MYRLTDNQVDYIIADLEQHGLHNEDLKNDLLDHICCIMEQQLEDEKDFKALYAAVVKTFYKVELRELEQETILMQTFKNYYTMKKTMILSGLFSVCCMLLGIWFKIMHFPGAAVILPAGILTGSFIFLPLLVILKSREQKNLRDRLLILIAALSAIILLTGMALKLLMNNPHSVLYSVMFYISMGAMFGIFLPVFIFTGIRDPLTKFNTIVTSIMVIMIYAVIFTMTYKSL